MKESILTAIANHLSFLGYRVEEDDEGCRIARHPSKPLFLFRELAGGVQFLAFFPDESRFTTDDPHVIALVNDLNKAAAVSNFHVSDDRCLVVAALMPTLYEREAFGLYLQALEHDLMLAVGAMGEE